MSDLQRLLGEDLTAEGRAYCHELYDLGTELRGMSQAAQQVYATAIDGVLLAMKQVPAEHIGSLQADYRFDGRHLVVLAYQEGTLGGVELDMTEDVDLKHFKAWTSSLAVTLGEAHAYLGEIQQPYCGASFYLGAGSSLGYARQIIQETQQMLNGHLQ